MSNPPDFVHLRAHSDYSLLSAPARLGGLVKAAVADEQKALGLTDNGNLYGSVLFYKACRGAGIKSILGQEVYVASTSRHKPTGADNPVHQLTLLAANLEGWENLKRISSYGFLEGFYYKPRVDPEILAMHCKGIIALSGDLTGEISRMLQSGDTKAAVETVGAYRELFGKDNFYLEMMDTGLEAQRRVNPLLLELHTRLDVPVVATNDVHYIKPDDWVAQDIMTCVRSGKVISDPKRYRIPSREHYFKTREQMGELFRDVPQALAATVEIAERCDVEIDMDTYHLPIFDSGPTETTEEYFVRECYEGVKMRYGEITPKIKERLDYEMGVINQLGFPSYFLITADFIQHARDVGIPVGPGRGSAAGSIVAYALKITNLDPLKYNLIFERFLNSSRISMPDIDVDFCGNRREEVIQYVREKYGEDQVSMIITFGTMASRGVLRDVGRVLEVPLADVDKIAKKVQQGPGASLMGSIEEDAELDALRKSTPELSRLFDLGLKLEGASRHSSIHAAGVVVSDRPLRDYVPLCKKGDVIVSQWQMTELEEVGLLKVDFLGLKTLTILTEACRLIKLVHGIEIDIDEVPLDDKPTYELITRGDTLGVFQLESSGMRELLGRIKPDVFEDVVAVLALYRPGPLGSGMVDMFVQRKHGEVAVEYPHESLEPILSETYGVITYQEQVMRTANIYANFTMNEADSLRKAMGKKKPEVMEKFKGLFIDGAVKLGRKASDAKELFETIEYFAGYGFNKSHSAAYALITYQTAYLKAHYPVEFVAANMTVESGTTDKLKEYVDEMRKANHIVRPPDVNSSHRFFNVEDNEIRYGIGAVKGVGSKFCDLVAEERDKNGPYTSLENFCERQDPTLLNKGAIEALTKAGAFDCIEPSRKGAIGGLEQALRASVTAREDKRKGQGSLFGFDTAPAPVSKKPRREAEWNEMEKLTNEKNSLGFYFSGHPFEKRGRFFARLAGSSSENIEEMEHSTEVRLAGMITGVRIMNVRSGRNAGKKMARFNLEDLHNILPVVVFAKTYEEVRDRIEEDAIVFLTARVDKASDEIGLMLDDIQPASIIVGREVSSIVVNLDATTIKDDVLDQIAEITSAHDGNQHLLLEVKEGDQTFRVRADSRYSVTVDDDLIDDLAEAVGPENLSFTRR